MSGLAWNCSAEACRSSYRVGEDPGFQDACFAQDATGFRCMRRTPSPGDTNGLSQQQSADEEAAAEAKEETEGKEQKETEVTEKDTQ